MRLIILKLINIATIYYAKFILTCGFVVINNQLYALDLFYHNQDSWEASILPIIDGAPAVDNGDHMYGSRFALSYFFYNYNNKLEIGVDASVAYLKTNKSKDEPDFSKSITILSPAILARWNFDKISSLNISPFVAAGIGPSYMSNNDFEGRDLGIRFSFQDIGGLGFKTKISPDEEFILGLYIIHYSNASIDKDNRGITIPFSAKLAYRF